jgi:N-acetylmuramoyl-L-alanine amidase
MEIKNHLLFKDGNQIEYIESPNTNGESHTITPSYLIVHYTADSSIDGAINWFRNPKAEASAHLVIGRDGKIVQMVPFNQRAWHAGKSQWGHINGLNSYSIGIELVNSGKLVKKQGAWVNWAGHIIPSDEVIEATHKNEKSPTFWHEYTSAQIDATIAVSKALVPAYSILEALGHDDIAPSRKCDPGPAFPMNAFISRAFGRS